MKKSVFVLVLILFFSCSLVAAAGLQVQTQAPVNKTVATAETTPVKLSTTTAVPVQTAVKTTVSVPVQTAVKTATTVPVFATATKTTAPVPVPTSAKGPLTFGTVSPSLLPAKTLTLQTARTTPVACPSGWAVCNGTCVNVSSDIENCGYCGQDCPVLQGYNCRNGLCWKDCAGYTGNSTEIMCNGQCTDVWWDNANCGVCGHRCISGETCAYGYCSRWCTSSGWGTTWHPVEDWTIDYESPGFGRTQYFCGDCSHKCAREETCINRQCTCPADSSHVVCSGVCVDILDNESHCGGCGQACQPAQECRDGACVTACGYGKIFCADHCVEPNSLFYCGDCSHDCYRLGGSVYGHNLNSPTCYQGTCRDLCGNEVVSIDGHELNCGFCGNECGPWQLCQQGTCVCHGAGNTTCGKDCINDFWSNEKHCGRCNNQCGEDAHCRNNMCDTCPWGSSFCSANDDTCYQLFSDKHNCGTCGHECVWFGWCSSGQCIPF